MSTDTMVEESNLVKHFRRELALLGEDSEWIESYVEVAQIVGAMRHSGTSHQIFTDTLSLLLDFDNLTPLTTDLAEWDRVPQEMTGDDKPWWQNNRNSKAISHDRGLTYWLVDETPDENNVKIMHLSEKPNTRNPDGQTHHA